jgi:GNAT superfamily N-acetyltransferase
MLLDRIEMVGIETERVIEELPTGFDELRAEAHMEGYCQIERLATDWDAGTTRFDRDGEVLLVVRVNETLVAIGGLTVEPVVPNALRMRRFYVRPAFRRSGVGRELVRSLLARMRSNQVITVNAAPGSVPFWEAMGFTSHPRDGHTHIHPQVVRINREFTQQFSF